MIRGGRRARSLSWRHRRQCSTQTHDIMFLDIYDLFAAMFSPAAFAHWHLFVRFHLEEILANNSSQNGENRVRGAYPAYPKRTQGYASVERRRGKRSAKIKIGQANRLELTNKWFLFLGSSYVSVFCNRAAKTVKIGFGGCIRRTQNVPRGTPAWSAGRESGAPK